MQDTMPYNPSDDGLNAWEKIFPVVITGSATTSGTFYYTWTEQFIFSSGVLTNVPNPRNGNSTLAPLVEINNQQLTTFPVYAWVRFRGMNAGQPTYDFQAGQVTTSTATGYTGNVTVITSVTCSGDSFVTTAQTLTFVNGDLLGVT